MENTRMQKITVLIPCYNEESGIEAVIKKFPRKSLEAQGFLLEVLVIDNNSKDRTAEIARSCGAKVVHEEKKGKGNAIRTGMLNVSFDTDFVAMLDGDDTYRPEELLRMIEPLRTGFCNVVVGSRLAGRIHEGSMTRLNRAGNWLFSHLTRYIYRVNVTDVLSGYFAWNRTVIEQLRPHLVSSGFAIEMEMITKMAKLGNEIYSVPISYDARAGESNLRPFYDGSRILLLLLRNIFWKPTKFQQRRIAFVSDSIMPYHHGGKERRLYEITKRLALSNREVHIYTMQWWDGPETIQHEGVFLHALCGFYPLYTDNRRSIYQALMFGLATFKLFFERFDELDVDHMPFFPLFSARIVTWLRRKKMHATWHEVWGKEYWIEYLGGFSGMFGYLVEQLAFKTPDRIISNSIHTTNRLLSAGVEKSIQTIPLGVDLESVYTAEPNDTPCDVIFVGRLLSHKNADLLVKAIAQVKRTMPEICCKIIGTGPEKVHIEQLIKEFHLEKNVCMIDGVKESTALYGMMKASKMLVLPSVREGFGLIVIEANAAGIPVITTSHANNAAKDLIHEGVNGMLAEPNAEDIADKIIQILRIGDTLDPRRGIERYDWTRVTKDLEEVLALG
jgi:glycosyltransferase involved in cell wall biosynthesis